MRIFIFRGLAGLLFSTGMDQLARELNRTGHVATVHSWIERRKIQRKAILDFRNGTLREQIGLVGHSPGGNSANFMASNLAKAKVRVGYIATIDPTEPKPSPRGIQADNFRSRDFRAERVKGAKDFYFPELNHIQVDKDSRVHQRIETKCKELQSDSAKPNINIVDKTQVELSKLTNKQILELIMSIIGKL